MSFRKEGFSDAAIGSFGFLMLQIFVKTSGTDPYTLQNAFGRIAVPFYLLHFKEIS